MMKTVENKTIAIHRADHNKFRRLMYTLAIITNSGKMSARQGGSLELFSIELASPKKYNLIQAFSSPNPPSTSNQPPKFSEIEAF